MSNSWCKAIRQLSITISSNKREKKSTSDCEGKMVEDQVVNLEEARKVIRSLQERCRAQSHQLLSWRKRFKAQEELIARLNQNRAEQLKSLSAQLVLFESRLCRKQKDISALLVQREAVILRQERAIQLLQERLDASSEDLPHFASPTAETERYAQRTVTQ
jgi:hypothetical protein